jgi:hypothetical protein
VKLEDGEIALRPVGEGDIRDTVAACQDPEIPRWTRVPSPYTEEHARIFLRDPSGVSAIVDARTEDPLKAPVAEALMYRSAAELSPLRCARRSICIDTAWAIEWSRAVVHSGHLQAKKGRRDGPSPVDRGRAGSKHHLLVDASGIPLA